MVETSIENKNRQNRLRGTKNYALEQNLLDLAVRIGQQIFSYENDFNENEFITQIVPLEITQNGADDNERPKKKRKVETTLRHSILGNYKLVFQLLT